MVSSNEMYSSTPLSDFDYIISNNEVYLSIPLNDFDCILLVVTRYIRVHP
jgi:hypothetical protein